MNFVLNHLSVLLLVGVQSYKELSTVCAQGYHGVIVNNQKVENKSENTVASSTASSDWFASKWHHSLNDSLTSNHLKLKTDEKSHAKSSVRDLNRIISILNKNQTDLNKIDELVMEMNSTGSLTQINLINVNEKETDVEQSTIAPHASGVESVYRDKDSKELKVQFVLDCDLKDALGKDKVAFGRPSTARPTTKKPFAAPAARPAVRPAQVKPQVIYYPAPPTSYYQNPYQNFLLPSPYRPNHLPAVSVVSVTKRKPVKATTAKSIVKNVYVDPPAIASISNTLDNVYSYFEDVFTTKVKVPSKSKRVSKVRIPVAPSRPISGKLPRHRPIVKRSTVSNSRARPSTITPITRSTRFNEIDNKVHQHLTTRIHVSSEYVGKDPATTTTTQSSSTVEDYTEESEEYYEDDDDDNDDEDDDDYYDSISFEGFDADVSLSYLRRKLFRSLFSYCFILILSEGR